jgi:Flp pilus assembly protein TadG
MAQLTVAISRRCTGCRGQSLVELALILPVLTLLLVGMVDLGRVFFYQARLTNAVKEGAFYGAYTPYNVVTNNSDDVRDRAFAEANGRLGTSGTDFIIEPETSASPNVRCIDKTTGATKECRLAGRGDSVEVTGRYAFRPMTAQIIGVFGNEFWLRKTVRLTIVSGA